MDNAPDFIPDSQFTPDATQGPAPASVVSPQQPQQGAAPDFIPDSKFVEDQDPYSGAGQVLASAGEGLAKGVLGPLAPAIERGLGVKGEDILGRAKAHPFLEGATEGAGFLGSLAIPGLQENSLAGVVGKAGEAASAASGIGEASNIARIATTGVKAGAELAALKTSDELSRMVEGDPSQTIGSAAINIGLAGIIGGVGGAALGAVSPLWQKANNVLGTDKLATDFMGETAALRSGVDPLTASTNELHSRIAETDSLLHNSALINPEIISDSVPRSLVKDVVAKTDEIKSMGPLDLQDKDQAKLISKYLDKSQELADAVAKGHIDNDLPVPEFTKLNPTSVLNSGLSGKVSAGAQLARVLHDKGGQLLANAAGEGAASAIGGGLGSLVGHPVIGAVAGERLLGPIFSSLAQPLAETAVNSSALRSSVDYLANAFRGQKIINDSVSNLFTKGAEVVSKDLIPDQASRDKLDKSLTYFNGEGNAQNVGGQIGHYLPAHATAAAQTAAQASNYLQSLKPTQAKNSPLDVAPPVDKVQLAKYNRALDIAQQPLMPLKYIKDGTLQASDVLALHSIYPGVHSAYVNKITNELINNKGAQIPYSQRVGLNLLMGGAPLDSTMTPSAAQAIIHSQMAQQTPQAQGGQKKASGTELKQVNQVNSLYATKNQASQIADRK